MAQHHIFTFSQADIFAMLKLDQILFPVNEFQSSVGQYLAYITRFQPPCPMQINIKFLCRFLWQLVVTI